LIRLAGTSSAFGQLILAHPWRLEELLQQNLPRVHRRHYRVRHRCLLLVIVNDLHVFRSRVRPDEADTPLPVQAAVLQRSPLVSVGRGEPEMGANVFSRLRTQRDLLRMFSQVKGFPFDSVRR
jgi:hypothetical protein